MYYLATLIKSLKNTLWGYLKVSKLFSFTRGIKAFWPPCCSPETPAPQGLDRILCLEPSPSSHLHTHSLTYSDLHSQSHLVHESFSPTTYKIAAASHAHGYSHTGTHTRAHAPIPSPGVICLHTYHPPSETPYIAVCICLVCQLPSEYKVVEGKDFCLLGSLCTPSTKKNVWYIHNRPSNIG